MAREILDPAEIREFALGLLFPMSSSHSFCRDMTYCIFLNNCQAVRAIEDATQKMVELRFVYVNASNNVGNTSLNPIRFYLNKQTGQVAYWRAVKAINWGIPQESDQHPNFQLQIDDLREINNVGDNFRLLGNLDGAKNYKSLSACN